MRYIFFTLILVNLFYSNTHAQFIVNPVMATTNLNESAGTSLINAYNGEGLADFPSLVSEHSPTTPENSFVSTIFLGKIDFFLGGEYSINGISFWNQNNGGPSTNTGVDEVQFFYSTDNVNYIPIPGAPTNFLEVTSDDSPPEIFTFNSVNASYIRMETISNHGDFNYIGFGEIAFSSSTTLNIQENQKNGIVKLFPNPSNDIILISNLKQEEVYSIYDSYGKKVLSGTVFNNQGVNIRNLRSGLYFFNLGNTNIIKFIKQ